MRLYLPTCTQRSIKRKKTLDYKTELMPTHEKVNHKMKAINWIIGAKPNIFAIKWLLHLKVILDLNYPEWLDKIIH